MEEFEIYTDGGSRGNPGLSGAGAWLKTVDKRYCKFLGENKTNNEAEYEALLLGLEKALKWLGKNKSKKTKLVCHLDSELVVKQLNHQYKLRNEKIQRYFIDIWNKSIDFGKIEFKHIPREKNKIADSLANQAMDEGALK